MRIGIDAREALSPNRRGKAQWAFHAIEALLRRSDVRCVLYGEADAPAEWKTLPGFERMMSVPARGLRWHTTVARLLRTEGALDCYLSPTSFIVPYLAGKRFPCIPVIHDLIAFQREPHDRKAQWIERWTLSRVVRTAAALCTVSDATAEELRHRFQPSRPVTTVHAGPTWAQSGSWKGGGKHILCIGTLCPRKNQLRLIEAFHRLPEDLRGRHELLLVGGRGWDDDAIVRAAERTAGVRWLGYKSDDECRSLLETCAAFASVSHAEGFNLPVLDALVAGAPLLASDIPTTREVAGSDACVLVDPSNTESIADGLAHMLTDTTGTEKRRTAGLARAGQFLWQQTAEKLVKVCRQCVDKQG